MKKVKAILIAGSKFLLILVSLYFFICSLSFLSDSFRLLGGKNIGAFFSNSDLLGNPIVGVMIGVLVTVLVQSSSTSTSIIVGLVAAEVPVRVAIPMIMGANIGTSVTNTIVSFTQVGDREEFKRAFAAATVHDMFNWLTVIVMVVVEVVTGSTSRPGYLEYVTGKMVDSIEDTEGSAAKPPDFLKVITKPFTKSVIQLDKAVLKGWAQNDPQYENVSSVMKLSDHCGGRSCPYLFYGLSSEEAALGDVGVGVILLLVSLVMLCGCLVGLVRLLNSLLGDKVKTIISDHVNKDIPVRGLGWLTGYLAMVVGAVLTILVQSSSVFTSTLTPLAGAGLVSLDRVYPLTLGSNIGTTTTSLLAALAASGHQREALQIALVHLMFNIHGILLLFPVPSLRLPVSMARRLGEVTARYRWFSLAYLLLMFFIFPAIIFGLSLAGPVAMYVVLVPLFSVFVLSGTLTLIQRKAPTILPARLRTWAFLPEPLRSLAPVDRLISRVNCVRFKCIKKLRKGDKNDNKANEINLGYQAENV